MRIKKMFEKCDATVLRNISFCPADKQNLPYNLYFDNLFTSMQLLLNQLKVNDCGATGTLRDNRCEKCPLTLVASLRKMLRGTVEYVADSANQILVLWWMDSSVVTTASTCNTKQVSSKAK